MKLFRSLALAALFLLPVSLLQAETPAAGGAANPAAVAKAAAAQRELWNGHIFWIRNVVVETLAGNADAAKAAENEVVANAKAIAHSIEPFYGKTAADKLFGLLAGHYGAVKAYLDATKANDAAKRTAALDQLTANAKEIARFLSGANPNLPYDTLVGLLSAHGAHHVQQIDELHTRKYAEEGKTWSAMSQHVNTIADALADALAKQFPAKFA